MKTAIWIFQNFGAILVFQVVYRWVGFREALMAGIGFAICEIFYLKIRKKKISGFLIFSSVLVVLFGMMDLYLNSQTFIKYEAILFSIAFGLYFAGSLFGKKSLVESLAEQQGRVDQSTSPDKTFFFRFITVIWAFYFFAKAFVCYLISQDANFADASLLRILIGTTSFYVLLAISVGLGPQIWRLLSFLKVLPSARS